MSSWDLSQPKFNQKEPLTSEEWLIPFTKYADLNSIKYPVVVVQEYGWVYFDLLRVRKLALSAMANCQVKTQMRYFGWCRITTGIVGSLSMWILMVNITKWEVDYLINACGYETGKVDDMAHYQRVKVVEFKAAYVTHWPQCQHEWPEVVFHGERGTPRGMAQQHLCRWCVSGYMVWRRISLCLKMV